ncbi:hypothetical protein [Virgibacillus ihumii]|uniref:hypothetical protein n=1 Tax=Virgibacillus ihumii TaxID=2686091 RepID=UPI00157D7AFE|nr:hypothetical protein [Virgibacillus ihumii]
MRKYWKLIVIVPLIVIVIGAFYIKSALSAGSYPEIVFKKEQGDKTAIQDVVLEGGYYAESFSSELSLTTDGAEFDAGNSFFERISGMYNKRIAALQDKYRSFMRGKSGTASSYVETDKVVGYADVINQSFGSRNSDMEFSVAILNKENNEAVEFSAVVPNRAMYNSVRIQDVQYVNGELKVITKNIREPSETTDVNEEIHVYSFNMEKKELVDEELIMKTGYEAYTRPLSMSYHYNTSPSQIVIFKKLEDETVQQQDMKSGAVAQQVKTKVDSITAYNLKTEQKLDVKLPEKLRNQQVLAVDGSNLYLQSAAEGKMEVIQYGINQRKITNRFGLDAGDADSQYLNARATEVHDGKLYVLFTKGNSPVAQQLTVVNIGSGEPVYVGEITLEQPSKEKVILNFFEMSMRSS